MKLEMKKAFLVFGILAAPLATSIVSGSISAQPLSNETQSALRSAAQDDAIKTIQMDLDLSAREFYEEIEREARAFYDSNKDQFSHIQRSSWNKLVHISRLRLESLGIGVKALSTYAKPAMQTFVVTNIVSTFVLPPILTALGQPGLAMLVLATPFELFIAAGQVFVMRSYRDMILIRNLGFSDYLSLRKLRRELLGMSERAHVMSLIQEDVMRELGGLSIVVTDDVASRGRYLAVRELEQMVAKDPYGSQWLDTLVPLRNKRSLYALELWIYIQERSELRGELLNKLKARLALSAGDSTKQKLSSQFHELLELKKNLEDLDEQFSKTLKSQMRNLSSSERQGLKTLSTEASAYVEQVKSLVELSETHVLWQLSQNDKQLVDLDSSVKLLRDSIRSFRAAIPIAASIGNDRWANEKSLREILRLTPEASKRKLSACNEALQQFIRWGRYSFRL
jgi:hypothetical protein